MNRKILSFLISLVFILQTPTLTYAKRINQSKDSSQNLKKSSFISKIKNNIDNILISGVLIIDGVLLYKMFHHTETDQQRNNNGGSTGNATNRRTPAPQYADEESLTNVSDEDIGRAPIRGIPNMGNSCYLNTAIQQLYRIDEFRKAIFFQRVNGPDQAPSINPGRRPHCWALYRLFCYITYNINMSNDEIRECVNILGYRGNQEDTAEFMTRVIGRCSTELNQQNIIQMPAPLPLTAGGKNLIDELNEHSDIDAVALRARIEQRFSGFFQDAQNFIFNSYYSATTSDAPRVSPVLINEKDIIVPINRTSQNIFVPRGASADGFHVNRSNNRINIPFRINPSRDFNIQNDNREFTLSCVSVHLGSSGERGHYMTYRKSDDGKWYCINDDNVSEVPYALVKVMSERNCAILTYSLSDNNEKDPNKDESIVQSLREFITYTVQNSGKSQSDIINLINLISRLLNDEQLVDNLRNFITQTAQDSGKSQSDIIDLINRL